MAENLIKGIHLGAGLERITMRRQSVSPGLKSVASGHMVLAMQPDVATVNIQARSQNRL